MCFFNFIYSLSKTFIQRSFEFDFIKTAQTSSCKVSAIFITLQWNSNSFDRLSKDSHSIWYIRVKWKCVQWEISCSTWTDRQTDEQPDRHDV